MSENNGKRPLKVFISHSSLDIDYVEPIVNLFEYIGLNDETMFCSSVAGYKIPLNKNIKDYLQEQFHKYDLKVIFVLSDNYYNSTISMNEMGAAWALQLDYTSILLPGFDFKDIRGVVDSMRISIKLDSEVGELRERFSELRSMFVREMGLRDSLSAQNAWMHHLDKFVETVNDVSKGNMAIKKTTVYGDSYSGNAKNESLGTNNTFNGNVYIHYKS